MSHKKYEIVFSEVIEGSGAVNQSQWAPLFYLVWDLVVGGAPLPPPGVRGKKFRLLALEIVQTIIWPLVDVAVGQISRSNRTPKGGRRSSVFSLLSPPKARSFLISPGEPLRWEISGKRVGGNNFFFFVQGEEDGRGRIFDKWQGSQPGEVGRSWSV